MRPMSRLLCPQARQPLGSDAEATQPMVGQVRLSDVALSEWPSLSTLFSHVFPF